jgi:hypothetical protein
VLKIESGFGYVFLKSEKLPSNVGALDFSIARAGLIGSLIATNELFSSNTSSILIRLFVLSG